ncbi:MAG: hypothetical protein PSV46_07775 [Reyranella sp.]|nr:hypothetical protein [Reyranella sp.]
MRPAELSRVYELVASLKGAPKSYFKNFATSLRDNSIKRKYFIDIEAELSSLDAAAWVHLKTNVRPLFMRGEKVRGWQAAFSELNEAKAYNFLVRRGYTCVEFIPRRSDIKTPDLRAKAGNIDVLCEAKTINRSERALLARKQAIAGSVPNLLPEEFFTKLRTTVERADQQMGAYSSTRDIKRIIYFVINFDDWLHECIDDCLVQISGKRDVFMMPGLEVVLEVKPKFYSATSVSPASHMLIFTADAPWRPSPKID